ncbi:MAG: ADP-ribosylglycohydrolase family protein [Chloroflexota bacterium]
MLLELAIGDAYGAGFEYADKMVAKHNDLSRYIQHPRHKDIRPSMYTDDTQMTLAIAELLVENVAWTPINIANKFVVCFKRDERTGYAGRFYDFLQSVADGAEFLERIIPESDKSGAAMRVTPLGVLSEIDDILEKTEIQAKITHNTLDGIQAAQASALLAHYFIYKVDTRRNVGKWLNKHVPSAHDWDEDYVGKVKAKGWMSVKAAITAVKRNNSLSQLLLDCINFTGDVDTVATIAIASASNSHEYQQDLPQHLVDTLENDAYSKDYLLQLNAKLVAMVT